MERRCILHSFRNGMQRHCIFGWLTALFADTGFSSIISGIHFLVVHHCCLLSGTASTEMVPGAEIQKKKIGEFGAGRPMEKIGGRKPRGDGLAIT